MQYFLKLLLKRKWRCSTAQAFEGGVSIPSTLMQYLLIIPQTSVEAERAFSAADIFKCLHKVKVSIE